MEIPDVNQVSVLYQENQVVLLFAREAAPGQTVATTVGHDHHVVPEGEAGTASNLLRPGTEPAHLHTQAESGSLPDTRKLHILQDSGEVLTGLRSQPEGFSSAFLSPFKHQKEKKF